MFQAELRFDDLDSPLVTRDGGILLGGSTLVPVRHRMLHALVLASEARIAIVSAERFPDDPEGSAIDTTLSDAALQARLDAFDDHLLDVAIVTIDRRRRSVSYRASPVVAVPCYLIADARGVAIDWDYARLLAGRRTEIVWDIALAQIAGISTYGPRTIVAGVYRATAGATLTVNATGVDIRLPDAIVHEGAHELVPDADIEALFFDTVTSILDARPLNPVRTAVELSGGMDSALTAMAAAALAGPGLMSIGAQFDGAMGEAQRARRLLLCERGGFDDLSIPAERFAAFAPGSHRRVRHGVWPEDENYPEMFEAIFAMLHAAGIDTLISGLGGDELYVAYEGEDGTAPLADATACRFLTANGLVIAQSAKSRYPRGWLQETCWQGAASQSQRVLRYGLWPIHPYHTPALARFVSRLPRCYRRHRQLLRSTLTRILGTPLFETGYIKETFSPVAVRGMIENRDYLLDLVGRSPLSRHPDIDDRAILDVLSGDIAALDRETFSALFRVLKLFCFFQASDGDGEGPSG